MTSTEHTDTHQPRGAKPLAARIAAGSLAVLSVLGLAVGLPAAGAAAVTRADLYYSRIPSGFGGTGTTATGTTATATDARATEAQQQGVVLINTTTPSGSATGTGMVLNANGLVLTNYHVVEGSTEITVTLASSGQTYTATVLGHDASKDVAALQLQGASGLTPVRIDTDGVRTGEAITAVGNAGGRQVLVQSPGRVTDPTAQVTASDEGSSSGTETLTNVFQTTAAAEPGDSGGPMYDSQGEVVGITTAGSSTSGGGTSPYRQTGQQTAAAESYGVTIDSALGVVNQVTANNESGTVRIGPNAYLGVQLQGDQLTLAGVQNGTPAAQAGLAQGDTITAIDGTRVSTAAGLQQVLAGLEPGQQVSVSYLDQNGSSAQVTLTLAASPIN